MAKKKEEVKVEEPVVSEEPKVEEVATEPVVEEPKAEAKGKVKCSQEDCGKTCKNAYELSKHVAEKHADNIDMPSDISVDGPQMQVLRFTQPVEFNVNGKAYVAVRAIDNSTEPVFEVEIEHDRVPSAMDTLINAYGKDILAV